MPGQPDDFAAIIRRLAAPLDPQPTGETPVLPRLGGIRAVLFDVYGTLFVSASGDIDAAAALDRGSAFTNAAALCGLIDPPDGASAVRRCDEVIARRHAAAREEGVAFPEVDVLDVWRSVFGDLVGQAPDDAALKRFATVYENLVNPVWPMPGCRETLDRLREANLPIGLVSNAQFYTLPMFEGLLEATPEALGIGDDLVVLSYRIGHAKPGTAIFEHAAAALERRGISPDAALVVGNDLLNDVAAAEAVGFRTALFAGDRRSLRKREGDARVQFARPDVVLTDLRQLTETL
jgi:putative hydrolase of the HAD superfamily